jgi:hypothetical protein
MEVETLAPYLAGPGAAVIICVLVGYVAYHILMKVFLPLFKASIERHFAQIDAMMSRHDEAHAKIMEGLTTLQEKIVASQCRYVNGAADFDQDPVTNPGVRRASP